MTTSLGEASHLERLVRLRGYGYWNDEEQYQGIETPSKYAAQQHRDLWKDAGYRANEVADALEHSLNGLLEGWQGKGARAFEKKVRQVIYFAGMIAHQCDSTYPEPTKPEGYDESSEGGGSGPQGPEAPSAGGGDEKAFYQVWDEIVEKLEECTDDEKNPPFPWTLPENNYYMEADKSEANWGFNMGLEYRVKNNDEDIWGDKHQNDTWDEYCACFGGSSVDSLVGSGKLTKEDGDGNWVFFWPNGSSNMEKFYIHVKLNETENTTSKDFVQGLMAKYGDWPEQEPQPIQPPKLFSDNGNGGNGGGNGGGGGGGGGGGSGSMPGGPGGPVGPESPDIPDRPDMEDDPNIPDPNDPNRPDIPDPNDPNNPNDPELPEQPDDPDTRHPNLPDPNDPNLPDEENPNIPDPNDPRFPNDPRGPGMPDDNTGFPGPGRDTGTETARTGGGPGTITPGGPGTTGTSGFPGGGAGGAGAGGAGVAPGMGGGMGAGGAGAGGAGAGAGSGRMGGMGGMMPMMGGGMGGGAGEGGDEGERDTWLNEDEDV